VGLYFETFSNFTGTQFELSFLGISLYIHLSVNKYLFLFIQTLLFIFLFVDSPPSLPQTHTIKIGSSQGRVIVLGRFDYSSKTFNTIDLDGDTCTASSFFFFFQTTHSVCFAFHFFLVATLPKYGSLYQVPELSEMKGSIIQAGDVVTNTNMKVTLSLRFKLFFSFR